MSDKVIYTVGGTVQASGGIYISRDADEKLLRLCRAGEFCYVLTARQVGKSSLMVATIERLAAEGIRSVEIDLNEMGTELSGLTAEQWYLGLIDLIVGRLNLEVNYIAWWDERARLGPTHRLSRFLRQVVLEQVSEPVVIFIDEIDFTLNLDFRDDFFAAIRACHNARARDPVFKRLSFVLLGVAAPSDLISDPQRTPFNIGQRMDLTDFTNREAIPLAAGLDLPPAEADQVLTWILDWTRGHPYLTQRLCAAAAASPTKSWGAAAVNKLVEETLFGEQSAQDSNLQFVRDMLTQRAPDKAAVLKTYRRIHAGQTVPDEERSPVKTHLKLSGIVKRKGGNLVVRNRIYEQVFNQEWIMQTMPLEEVPSVPARGFRVFNREWIRQNMLRVALAIIAVAILLAVTLGGYTYHQSTIPTPVGIQVQTLGENFLNTGSADVRAGSLAGLLKLGETDPKCETQAHQLFDTLTPDEKGATLISLFKLGETEPESKGLVYRFFNSLTSDERAAILASLFKLGETESESERLAYQFFAIFTPDEKVVTLAHLLELPSFEDRARVFFYEKLTPEEQLTLFKKAEPGAISTLLIIVVKGLYTELQDNDQDNRLLEAMAQPLRELDDPMAVNLATEIGQWLTGRKAYAAGEYQQAVDAYSAAISLNDRHPGTHFDRAIAYAGLGQYEEALADFQEVLQLDEKRALSVDKEIRSNGALYDTLTASRAQYPELVAVVPTPTPTLTFTPTLSPTPTLTPTQMPVLPTATPVPPTATKTPTPTPVPPTATATHTPRPPAPTSTPTAVPPPSGPIALTIYLRDTLTETGSAALSGDQVNGGMIYKENQTVYGDAAVQIGATTYNFDKPLPDPWRVEFEFSKELVARTGGMEPGFDPKKAGFWVGALDGDSAVGEDNPYSLTMKLYEGSELRKSIQVFFTVADAPESPGPPVREEGKPPPP
jgi:tetratricopeptide (TPR) repeat protein